jgi:hypothetical protein
MSTLPTCTHMLKTWLFGPSGAYARKAPRVLAHECIYFFGGNGGDPRFVEWRRGGASFKGILPVKFELFDSRAFQSAVLDHFEHFEKRGSQKV